MDGAVIFIDEVDGLAGSRDSGGMHEATRRLLTTILQRVEGFHGKSKSLLVCATNRKQDLDAALLSRFDLSIHYDLPNPTARLAIIQRYAKQFTNNSESLKQLVDESHHMSCRDIKEACEQAERRWASRLIRKERGLADVPSVAEYLASFQARRERS
jgi:ATP-dependent 26S proteasome regulatory subunit